MTKSALAVARQAMAVAAQALPAYSAPRSRHIYTLHQLFAALAVRQFPGTDHRGTERHLRDWSDLRRAIGLGDRVPDHPQASADRLLKKGADALIADAVRAGRRLLAPRTRAAVDSTGFDGRSAATPPCGPAAGWPSGGGRNGRSRSTSGRT